MFSHLMPAPFVLVTWKILSTFYLTVSLHLNVGSVFSKHSIFVRPLIMNYSAVELLTNFPILYEISWVKLDPTAAEQH